MTQQTEVAEVPAPLKVPNAWRSMEALREAWQMLEANPDLVGEDLATALASEAPDAVMLLDALVHDCQRARADKEKDERYVERMAARAEESEARRLRKEEMLKLVMQQLNLRSHRAPAGTASLTRRKGKVLITDPDSVPMPFRTEETVIKVSIDKRWIAHEFDEGRRVPGAERGNAYDSIRISG